MGVRRRLVAGASACALALAYGASASADERGIDPNQGDNLVEVEPAEQGGRDPAPARGRDVRHRVQRPLPAQERRRVGDRARLRDRGRDRRRSQTPATRSASRSRARTRGATQVEARQTAISKEKRADAAALGQARAVRRAAQDAEIVVLRADYFENYAGRFLSVEAKTRLRRSTPRRAPTPGRRCPSRGTGRRHRDRLHAAADEREHRPGHDARHLHRASRARPHRRRRAARRRRHADADPHRLEHGRVDRGRRQALARRRPAADARRLPVGLHDALHGPDRGLPRFDDWRRSSRTSRS